jgi:hypothetical protein
MKMNTNSRNKQKSSTVMSQVRWDHDWQTVMVPIVQLFELFPPYKIGPSYPTFESCCHLYQQLSWLDSWDEDSNGQD